MLNDLYAQLLMLSHLHVGDQEISAAWSTRPPTEYCDVHAVE
jgi:hypothetical protein